MLVARLTLQGETRLAKYAKSRYNWTYEIDFVNNGLTRKGSLG